jgi:uncharacterized Zn finger protein/superfamily II DNA or RNA helicase
MSKYFGKTWWGEQWLNALSQIDYGNRLPRGSSYARKGSVKSIDFIKNKIIAKVAGSRPKPYDVTIELPIFQANDINGFIKTLAEKQTIVSKLLGRELDPEVMNIADQHNMKVFPKQWSDFKMHCSCPDGAVPCKHLAAVVYQSSIEIDNDPFQVFKLHDMDLMELLKSENITVTNSTISPPSIHELFIHDQKIKPKTFTRVAPPSIGNISQALIALLSEKPAFYTGIKDFREIYRISLNKIIKESDKIINGKILLASLGKVEDITIGYSDVIKIEIDEHHKFQSFIGSKKVDLFSLLNQMNKINTNRMEDYDESVQAIHNVLNIAMILISNGAITPQIMSIGKDKYKIRWLPAIISKEVMHVVDKLDEVLPPIIHFNGTVINKYTGLNFLSVLLTNLISKIHEDVNDEIIDLFFKEKVMIWDSPGTSSLAGGVMAWLQKYYLVQAKYSFDIVVEEVNKGDFKLDLNIKIPIKKTTNSEPILKVLSDKKYEKERFEIVHYVTQFTKYITGLDQLLNSKGSHELMMKNEVFSHFLMEMIPVIQLLNIDVLLPKSLQKILRPKASISVGVSGVAKSQLKLQDMLNFDWRIALGDHVIDEAEFKKILSTSQKLIKYKSSYIYVTAEDVEKIQKHFSQSKTINSIGLLKAALSEDYEDAKVELTDEVKKLIAEFTSNELIKLPSQLNANLRPYQQRGFSWMYKNHKLGFGSLMADDMGLGKTLQVITFIQKCMEEGDLKVQKVLVISPTGLITNWQMEIKKFAPNLRTFIYHGNVRTIPKVSDFDVMLTSYGIARSDEAKFKGVKWHTIIIDEAQNIKNASTAQTKAVKALRAGNYIAMSGTPVENRLSELWSIMDFSMPQYLGNVSDFTKTYGVPIEKYQSKEKAELLKKVTAPFIMRRLKTDKSIISDLPDKIELNSFASLTSEQAGLYEKTVQNALAAIEGIEGQDSKSLFSRQGMVLQMILALKQICNHPAQFLKNKQYDPNHSGKVEMLFDKLDSIIESNEKVLIFTQFTEMGEMLSKFIEDRYEQQPLYYHGGCSLKQRKEMVDRFQNEHRDKIFILSLKAAGTGLNLTAANHVIHFDLWWNPAVESQATDRAFRIGQNKNVMVHRFITKDTFEEKINEMIQNKKLLAELTVSTGENWIGKMSNKDLRELFS